MQVFNNPTEMQNWCLEQKRQGKTIGLVPTMGYLHEGHLALVRKARTSCDTVVVSIFVNPIQFNVGQDFEEYPRDLKHDSALLEQENVDAIFAPSILEMYPQGYNSFVELYGEITEKLCGGARPGHFKGVTTVVSKLFHICLPDRAFFGQKDAQQVLVIEKMVRELNFPLKIVRVPIVREADGLAKSSRNVHLDKKQRQEAVVLSQSLKAAERIIAIGEINIEDLKKYIRDYIETRSEARIEYVEIYSAYDLSDLEEIKGEIIIALAVWFGTTRLIDNLIAEV
ncbi:MAG TPA: pantoate--beta-alanine ligase [Syntrophomonadaceae bacterium]|nr:pantoate--beta-alanine ligase [Syntrophomonadaceae bacterium]